MYLASSGYNWRSKRLNSYQFKQLAETIKQSKRMPVEFKSSSTSSLVEQTTVFIDQKHHLFLTPKELKKRKFGGFSNQVLNVDRHPELS